MSLQHELFGRTAEGEPVEIFTLINARGLKARLTTWGAGLVELHTPDRRGDFLDVTLGFDQLDGYLGAHPHFGVTTGRFANRISRGRFTLDGVDYQLPLNDGANHLHGGVKGFYHRNWEAAPLPGGDGVRFSLISPHGEEGFPGTMHVAVTYTLTEADELRLDYEAITDLATVVNLTNHAYWNLADGGSGDILGHELTIHADQFLPVGAGGIPTGQIQPVAGGPMDFRLPKLISRDFAQMTGKPGGYDHTWVLPVPQPNPPTQPVSADHPTSGGTPDAPVGRPAGAPGEPPSKALTLAAEVCDPRSGRVLTVSTNEPGLQFYTGNFLDGKVTGKAGRIYRQHAGLCLETQHFPDSPNRPQFPSTILRPGETFRSTTVHRFSVRG